MNLTPPAWLVGYPELVASWKIQRERAATLSKCNGCKADDRALEIDTEFLLKVNRLKEKDAENKKLR